MAEQQMVVIALLLTAAVVYGYFYFKRAQARTHGSADARPGTDPDQTKPTQEG